MDLISVIRKYRQKYKKRLLRKPDITREDAIRYAIFKPAKKTIIFLSHNETFTESLKTEANIQNIRPLIKEWYNIIDQLENRWRYFTSRHNNVLGILAIGLHMASVKEHYHLPKETILRELKVSRFLWNRYRKFLSDLINIPFVRN